MNISAEYFVRLLLPNIWEMYYGGEYFLRLFLLNISAMYYNICIQTVLPIDVNALKKGWG